MQYNNLPKDLRDNGKFCLWKFEERKGQAKLAKVPYQINGKRAQPNYERTFTDYSAAINAVSQYDGLGLGIFRGYSAVDIDHCINPDGSLTDLAKTIVEIFKGCYIEVLVIRYILWKVVWYGTKTSAYTVPSASPLAIIMPTAFRKKANPANTG